MSIQFTCDECGTSLKVKDELAGKRIKCKACSTAVRVPAVDNDEFGSDFLSAEESGETIEEPRLPPVSKRPAEKKKKRKSGSSAGTIRVVVGSVIGLAALGTAALVVVAAVGWVTSRQGVGRLGREINAIQAKANTQFEATAQSLINAMQNANADLAPVEQQFAQSASIRDGALAELSALKIPGGVHQGQELVAAAKEWISAEADFFVTDGPSIFVTLRDQSQPYIQRVASLTPTLEKLNRREVEANIKLLTAQKTYLEQNRAPIPPDLTARLSEQNQKLAGLQAKSTEAAMTAASAPAASAETRPVQVQQSAAKAPKPTGGPPDGAISVTEDIRLKPGMLVYNYVPSGWVKGEVRSIDERRIWVKMKILEGSFEGTELEQIATTLYIDPRQLQRTDLPEDEVSPFKPAVGAVKPKTPVDHSNESQPLPRSTAGKPVTAALELEPGMRLLKLWGASYREVEVLSVAGPDRVRIHWVGWGDTWDEECSRNGLFEIPAEGKRK